MTDEQAEQLHEKWRKKLAHLDQNPQKHAQDRGDHIYLLTWLAAIRWDLAPGHPERLRSDLQQVFHPWVDTFKNPPPAGKAVIHTPLPVEGIENDHVMHILRAHAEIQADACDLLAEVLEGEERILADQTNACDTAAPTVATGEEPSGSQQGLGGGESTGRTGKEELTKHATAKEIANFFGWPVARVRTELTKVYYGPDGAASGRPAPGKAFWRVNVPYAAGSKPKYLWVTEYVVPHLEDILKKDKEKH